MAIGFRAAGTAQAGTGNITIPVPAGQASTDMNVMVINVKPYTATISTPTDWNKLGEFTNGTTASGVDTGSVKVAIFTREGVTGSAVVNITGANVSQGQMIGYTRGGSDSWWADLITGIDATHGANYSATGDSNLNAASGDFILAYTGLNTDIGSITAQAITATGLTLGATQVRSQPVTTNGDDAGMQVCDCSVTSGTESAPPVFAFTAAGSSSGGTAFILLRVVTATITAVPQASGFATTNNSYQITLTGLTAFNEWSLTRESMTGQYPDEFVRGGALQPADNSSEVINDYEFHYSSYSSINAESFRYRLDLYKSGILFATIYSATKTPLTDRAAVGGFNADTYPTVWIKNVSSPGVNQPIVIKDFKAYNRQGKILGEHVVLGRKHPVVVTDVLGGTRGTFTALIYATPTWKSSFSAMSTLSQLHSLFDAGTVCMFQTTWPYVAAIPDFFFVVSSLNIEREQRVVDLTKTPTATDSPLVTITIEYIEVNRPSTLDVGVIAISWNDINNGYSSWNGVKNNNVNWLDVLQNA